MQKDRLYLNNVLSLGSQRLVNPQIHQPLVYQPARCLLEQNDTVGIFCRLSFIRLNVRTLKSPLQLCSDWLWSLLFACRGQGLYICGT